MKKIIITATVGIVVVAAAVAMDLKDQSDAQDSWFDPSNLKHAPASLAVVRVTHFPEVYGKIRERSEGDSLTRASGRDITFRDLMAEAYGTSPGQVVLPPDTANERFDFIVTLPDDVRERLQSAVRETTGYAARVETREVEALKLTVKDASLPGMTISPADEDEDMEYKDGRLYFKHKPLSSLMNGLEEGLGKPVVDETDTTNCYDFSVAWNEKVTESMQSGSWHLERAQKVLNQWGLGLEPATEMMDVVVVEKAQ